MIPKLARTLSLPVLIIGLWAGLVPFAGPAFGYPMPPGSDEAAWQWTASHAELHAAPAIAALAAGLGMMLARRWNAAVLSSALGVLAGTWLVLGPIFSSAWLPSSMGGAGANGMPPSTFMQVVTPLGYHYGSGIVIAISAALALGALFTARARSTGQGPVAAEYEKVEDQRRERVSA